jgi:hypothetical protein
LIRFLNLLQLLKKSGWKEGTGLGAQEQVCVWILDYSRVTISYFHFPQILMSIDFSGICYSYGYGYGIVICVLMPHLPFCTLIAK